MDMVKELSELKETIANEITEANKEIRKSGGDLNTGDIEMIDKLTHAMKSLVTTCAMLEAEEENGYSERFMPMMGYGGYSGRDRRDGYSREGRANRNGYSGNYGSYARDSEGRFTREGRNGGYSRGMDWNEQLRRMMDEAPDEATRMDIKKLMDRMAN